MKNVFGALLELASWLAIVIPLLMVAIVGTCIGIIFVLSDYTADLYDKLRGRSPRWK